MNVKLRQTIERQIARRIVRDALAAGYSVDVHDGEEITLKRSRSLKAIMGALMTTDDDRLLFNREGENPFGWVYLVYGNDGWDVVNDYSTNIESLMTGAQELSDKLEAQHG
jgi:hypothetical protein